MELFFDLIFVAAIAQIGIPLQVDFTYTGLFRYSFLFVLIWSAWSGHSLYCSRFESDDLVQRALTVVQCFLAAVMAANAKESLDSRSAAGFGAAYAGIRLVLAIQYARLTHDGSTRPFALRSGIGIFLAALLWVASALVPIPTRYVLWGVALTADLTVPWITRRHGSRFPPDAGHFRERVSLFTIILVGEYMASVMRGIESQETWSPPAALAAVSGTIGGFVIFWCYFDFARADGHSHTRTIAERHKFLLWYSVHLPLGISVATVGIGMQRVIGPYPLTGQSIKILTAALTTVAISLFILRSAIQVHDAGQAQPRGTG
jgi:low temperature requirement protein LtrA